MSGNLKCIQGSITALITPFRNGEVDEAEFKRFVDWQIAHVPSNPAPETFPASPRRGSAELIAWLLSVVMEIYAGEITLPNG